MPLSPSATERRDGGEVSTEIVCGDNGDSRGVGGGLSSVRCHRACSGCHSLDVSYLSLLVFCIHVYEVELTLPGCES